MATWTSQLTATSGDYTPILQTITPIDGELLYDIDEKKLYHGDGTTQGGIAIEGTKTTTVKTSNYTANNREKIPCDTSGGAFTVTTPTNGWFQVIDIVGNTPATGFGANTKALTISAASGTVMGSATLMLDVGGISPVFELIGTDWRITNHG